MRPHRFGLSLRLPLAPAVLEIPNQLLFLGINGDHGLSPLLKLSTLLAQILKLRIAVWMLFGPLFGLLQPLQAVLQIFPQNLANHGRARLISLLLQFRTDFDQTF